MTPKVRSSVFRDWLWAATTVVAVAAALSSVNVDAQGPSAQVQACQDPSGRLRMVAPTENCKAGEPRVVWNVTGPAGNSGHQGPPGEAGPQGPQGPAGVDAPPAEYGAAVVMVRRGNNSPASVWATYSTRIGSPVGDTTGGVFRFTCAPASAPCRVSFGAAILSNGAGAGGVYPRVLIQRQDYATGGAPTNASSAPQKYCEYGDGSFSSSTPNGIFPLTVQAPSTTPTYASVEVHIGGSMDCGGPVPTAGLISEITVPQGYYDVFSTFQFFR